MSLTRNAFAPAVFAIVVTAAFAVGWRDWQRLASGPEYAITRDRTAAPGAMPHAPDTPRPDFAHVAPFGTPAAPGTAAPEPPIPHPRDETALPPPQADYRLFGIIEAGDPARTRAILSIGNDGQDEYRVGDTMPDGARIHAVRERAVIFEHDGRLERLALPAPDTDGGGPSLGSDELPQEPVGATPPSSPAPPGIAPPPILEAPMAPTEVPPPSVPP